MAKKAFSWKPKTVGPIDGSRIIDNSIGGSKVISGDPAKTGQSDSGGFMDNLGKIALVGLAGAAAYGLWNKYGAGLFGRDEDAGGGGGIPEYQETYDDNGSGYFWSNRQLADNNEYVDYYYDATPPQPEPYTYMADVGFSDYGYSDWDFGGGGWSDYA